MYSLEGIIEPHTLIKIARKCNYDLGFRVYRTKQAMLEVVNGKVRLPEDFHSMNFALMAGSYTVTDALPQGTHIEERLLTAPDYKPFPETVSPCSSTPLDPCDVPVSSCGTFVTPCGDSYDLVQKVNMQTRTYKYSQPIYITDKDYMDPDCPNAQWKGCPNEGKIEHGFLLLSVDSAQVYVNYMDDMVDEEGNVIVPDHEMINEYYEYALKKRILENLLMNGENVGDKIGYIAGELRAARNYALTIVNTPNFKEMQKLWRTNRKAQYSRYYDMFRSFPPQYRCQ